jgi:hypothetical protein
MFDINQYDSFSFVFDGVLVNEINGEVNPHKDEMQALLSELIKKKKTVYIFTKRWAQADYDNRRSRFLKESKKNEYMDIKEFCDKFAINHNNVVYTIGNSYYSYISDNIKHCHFESSNYEKLLLSNYRPNMKVININEENWKEL